MLIEKSDKYNGGIIMESIEEKTNESAQNFELSAKSKIQKVEKLNKVTIEFTSERGDFRIIINDQVREDDKGFTMPKDEMRKLARTFAKVACLCYDACERDFEEE